MNVAKRIIRSFFNLFAPVLPEPCHVDLLAAGFTQKHSSIEHYEKDGFCLLLDPFRLVWLFDRIKKNAPGIIARFDAPLIKEDLDYILNFIDKENKQ